MIPLSLTINGNPSAGSKNRKVVRRWGDRVAIGRTAAYAAWKSDAEAQLRRQCQPLGLGSKREPLRVVLSVYTGKGSRLDLDNAAAGPLDALQAAGIISNDYWVTELSMVRLRDVDEPRVEITIEGAK